MTFLIFQKKETINKNEMSLELPFKAEIIKGCQNETKSIGTLFTMGSQRCVVARKVHVECNLEAIILGENDLKAISQIIKKRFKLGFTTENLSELGECIKLKKVVYETF